MRLLLTTHQTLRLEALKVASGRADQHDDIVEVAKRLEAYIAGPEEDDGALDARSRQALVGAIEQARHCTKGGDRDAAVRLLDDALDILRGTPGGEG